MANKNEPYVPFEKGENGLLGDKGTSLGHFLNTPKHTDDSAKTTTMARFTIDETLTEAIKKKLSITAMDSSLLAGLTKDGYFEFLLTGISTSSQDRYQLIETIGDNFVLFGFGEAPEIITCQGVLKNTIENDWQVQFLEFFKKIGGISALAKFYQYAGNNVSNFVTFTYNKTVKEGALLNVSYTLSANDEMDIAFSFSYVVTGSRSLGEVGQSDTQSSTAAILQEAVAQSGITNTLAKQKKIEESNLITVPSDSSLNPALSLSSSKTYKTT